MFKVLFHEDVFIPKEFLLNVISLEEKMTDYFISQHFEEHLSNQDNEDRSHTYLRDAVINTLNVLTKKTNTHRNIISPFEIEVSKDYHFFGKPGWIVTKFCIRIQHTRDDDLVVVLRPTWNSLKQDYEYDKFKVVTAWINHYSDEHKTLDDCQYVNLARWTLINAKR